MTFLFYHRPLKKSRADNVDFPTITNLPIFVRSNHTTSQNIDGTTEMSFGGASNYSVRGFSVEQDKLVRIKDEGVYEISLWAQINNSDSRRFDFGYFRNSDKKAVSSSSQSYIKGGFSTKAELKANDAVKFYIYNGGNTVPSDAVDGWECGIVRVG